MKRICLGKVVAAHGVKGLVKILPYGDDPSLLNGALYSSEDGEETLYITLKNPIKKYYLAEIEGITDRNQADTIAGTDLYIDRDQLPETEKSTYYHEDLIGLKALDEQGKRIGKVTAVENFGAGDLLEIKGPGFDMLVPFTKEHAKDIDMNDRHITIIPLEED